MGRRMQHISDRPFKYVQAQIVLSFAFLAGGISGTLFLWFTNREDNLPLRDYLVDYLGLFQEQILRGSFSALFWDALSLYLLLLLFGFVLLGVLGIPLLCFVQGFFLAFGIGCFWEVFGTAGLMSAVILFGLPAMFWAPVLFLAGTTGFLNALSEHGRRLSIFPVRRAVVCMALLFLSVLFEYWVVPILLRTSAEIALGTL